MTLKIWAAASLALSAGAAAAQGSQVQLYGRLNAALEQADISAGAAGQPASLTRVSNYRSVLGFRGSEELGNALRAIYQVEGTLSLDTGAGAIAARDTRVGLEGSFGTVFAGNWVTPYNAASASLDPFYPTTAGYMSIMGNGSASSADNVSDTASFDRRQQNSLHYWSPEWQGWSLRVARGMNEERPGGGARPSLTSAAAIYEHGALYFSAAHERHADYQGRGRVDTGSKVSLAYRFGMTRLAGVAEQLRYQTATGTLKRRGWYLSATHQMGMHGLRAGVARAGNGEGGSGQKIGFIRSGPDTGATHATVGYDYNLSKRSSLFVYYTQLRNDKNGVVDFATNSAGVSAGARLRLAAAGVRHAF